MPTEQWENAFSVNNLESDFFYYFNEAHVYVHVKSFYLFQNYTSKNIQRVFNQYPSTDETILYIKNLISTISFQGILLMDLYLDDSPARRFLRMAILPLLRENHHFTLAI